MRTIPSHEDSSASCSRFPRSTPDADADEEVENVYSASVVPASLCAATRSRYQLSIARSLIRYLSWSPAMGWGRECHSWFTSERNWTMKYLMVHPPDFHSERLSRVEEPVDRRNDP